MLNWLIETKCVSNNRLCVFVLADGGNNIYNKMNKDKHYVLFVCLLQFVANLKKNRQL